MLIIRFKPLGRRKSRGKKYRIVVAEKHKQVQKKFIESLGWYDPITKESSIKKDRLTHYLDLNIEISESVQSLFKKQDLIVK